MNKKIIAIIPARGGSKSVPKKNIKDLAGKPMIAYIIESALKVKLLDRVIVSTENEEIAEVARRFGAEVPFIRPAELATDEMPTLPVIQHAVRTLEEKENYVPDYVLLVYPTSPLLKAERIEEALQMAVNNDSDSVISGSFDYGHYWEQVEGGYRRLSPLKLENRQQSKPLFVENGAIYLTKTKILKKQLVADKADVLIMPEKENVDVDYPEDFEKVATIMKMRSGV